VADVSKNCDKMLKVGRLVRSADWAKAQCMFAF
jgi:hypothetical protein